jgi:hypothetical protein
MSTDTPDWDVVQAAVERGIRDYARADWIPANRLCGGIHQYQARMAANWAMSAAPFVTACIREDLRKASVDHV